MRAPITDLLADLDADGFGHWLAGFIDGEATFIINVQGQGYRPHFKIKLRDDDAAILYECQRRTGLGKVFAEKVYAATGRDTRNQHPQMCWQVTTQFDLPRLVLILERFPLRAKKRADFDIWKLGVREWTTKCRYGRWDRLEALRAQLAAVRVYRSMDDSLEAEAPADLYLLHPQLEGMG